jgi:hypothetical protein
VGGASTLVGGVGRFEGTLAHPTLLDDLLGQIRHANLAGPPGVEGRFDRGADVVGVNVAVVETVAADDDD